MHAFVSCGCWKWQQLRLSSHFGSVYNFVLILLCNYFPVILLDTIFMFVVVPSVMPSV